MGDVSGVHPVVVEGVQAVVVLDVSEVGRHGDQGDAKGVQKVPLLNKNEQIRINKEKIRINNIFRNKI